MAPPSPTDSSSAHATPPANRPDVVRASGRKPGRRRWLAGFFLLGLASVTAVCWPRLFPPPRPDPPSVKFEELPSAVASLIRRAREDLMDAPGSHEAWGALGMVLMAHRFDPEAVECFVEAERLEPQEFRWPYYQGIVLSVHDRQKAIDAFQRAVVIREDYEVARVRLAELLLDEQRLDDARTQLHAALDLQPSDARALVGMARVYSQLGDLDRALEFARRSVKYSGDAKLPHELLANVYQRLGKRDDALRVLEEMPQGPMLWYDPYAGDVMYLRQDTDWRIFQAQQALEQGQFHHAAEILRRALASDDDAPPHIYALLGRALHQSGQLTLAVRELDRGLQLHPQSPELLFQRGVVHFLHDEFTEAAARFRDAVRHKPDYHLAHYNLGHSLRNMGKDEEALAAFRDAVRLRPDYAPGHYNLARLLADLGQSEKAVEHVERALKIRPDDLESKQLLGELTESDQSAEAGPDGR